MKTPMYRAYTQRGSERGQPFTRPISLEAARTAIKQAAERQHWIDSLHNPKAAVLENTEDRIVLNGLFTTIAFYILVV